MKPLSTFRFPLFWLTLLTLTATSASGDAAMTDCIDATCRITAPDGGCGTGVVYHRDGEKVWVLTNAHIATANTLNLVFWRDGHQSRKIPGRTVMRNQALDAAVIAVDARLFGELLPVAIPIAAASYQAQPGQAVTSVGCVKGAWSTAWKGHTLRYSGSDLWFLPTPADGRSGSAIFNADGTKIIGLLRARIEDGTASHGVATSAEALWQVFREHNTQYTCGPNTCGPNSCPPSNNTWRLSPYRAQQDQRNHAQDDRIESLYPTMPQQLQPKPQPQSRPMVPVDVTPITTETPEPVDSCVAIELRLSILERHLKAQCAVLEQLIKVKCGQQQSYQLSKTDISIIVGEVLKQMPPTVASYEIVPRNPN